MPGSYSALEHGRRPRCPRAEAETAIVLRFGARHRDDLVHRRGSNEKLTLEAAVDLGLMDAHGYLTPHGYRYWQSRPVLRAV